MKLEKIYNSTIFKIFDFIYKLVMFNLLFVLTFILGLGLFSYLLSFIILVLAIKSLEDDLDYSIVKTWIINIKKYWFKALKLSLFYTCFLSLAIFNIGFFHLILQEQDALVYQVLYYFFLVFSVVMLFSIINSAFIFVYYPNLSFMKIIKYSFLLVQLIPLQALLLILMILVGVAWFYIFPFVLIFIWVSLSLYIFHKITKRVYLKLVPDNVKPRKITD
jgi:uncharacterized membrane protein YesL